MKGWLRNRWSRPVVWGECRLIECLGMDSTIGCTNAKPDYLSMACGVHQAWRQNIAPRTLCVNASSRLALDWTPGAIQRTRQCSVVSLWRTMTAGMSSVMRLHRIRSTRISSVCERSSPIWTPGNKVWLRASVPPEIIPIYKSQASLWFNSGNLRVLSARSSSLARGRRTVRPSAGA